MASPRLFVRPICRPKSSIAVRPRWVKAIPNTEILVINEQGQPCKPGEVGELVHRGPTVSMGYWGQPELTAKVLKPHPFNASELGMAKGSVIPETL